ncbi:hypothetical protein DRO26_00985 [Candidatus Bathyarchaeota archaeon]|nr:MAG: hypothetical protein DRO26_00985 [Candidatus Bathyarchaeota archaeon]
MSEKKFFDDGNIRLSRLKTMLIVSKEGVSGVTDTKKDFFMKENSTLEVRGHDYVNQPFWDVCVFKMRRLLVVKSMETEVNMEFTLWINVETGKIEGWGRIIKLKR